jgi:RNA polymerase sigma factor (sigma-70 family)
MSDIALPVAGIPQPLRTERLLGDERLAKLAAKGNAHAFGLLYKRHHQPIYRYCRSILGNDHDAQEALQSTMMRAYAALARQERDLAVKAWLFRIAHNEAISLLRKRRPEQELADGMESPSADVETTLQMRERLSTLVTDLGTLPERQRAALVMRELSGLSIHDIAQALAISDGAAKQTLFEARSSLHELEQGRAMECESVREAISQRDGRVLRGRRLRAHLAACEDCRAFRAAIATRQADLRAIAPLLPLASAGAIFSRLFYGAGSGQPATAALSSTSGASLTAHAATSLIAKGLAGTAVIAAATAGTVHLAAPARQGHRSGAGTSSPMTKSSHPPLAGATPGVATKASATNANAAAKAHGPGAAATTAASGNVSTSQGVAGGLGSPGGLAAKRGHARSSQPAVGHRSAPPHSRSQGAHHRGSRGAPRPERAVHRRHGSARKGGHPDQSGSTRPPRSGSKTDAQDRRPPAGERSPAPAVQDGEGQAPSASPPRPSKPSE